MNLCFSAVFDTVWLPSMRNFGFILSRYERENAVLSIWFLQSNLRNKNVGFTFFQLSLYQRFMIANCCPMPLTPWKTADIGMLEWYKSNVCLSITLFPLIQVHKINSFHAVRKFPYVWRYSWRKRNTYFKFGCLYQLCQQIYDMGHDSIHMLSTCSDGIWP